MLPLTLPPVPPPVEVPPPPEVRGRAERVDPGEEPSDFNAGDWEVKARLGFSGNGYGPQTLVTAFFNWFELQAAADRGIWEREYLSLGVGVEAWIGRPLIPEATSTLTSDSGAPLDWRASSQGLGLRGTAHYTWLSSFDPYALVLVGPSLDTVRGERTDRGAIGRFTSGGLRVGVGGGINVVTQDRVMGGVELRYLIAPRFRSGENVPILDEGGVEIDSFDVGRAQRPPRGLSWVFFVGLRF